MEIKEQADWEKVYQLEKIEELPWYEEKIDLDLDDAIQIIKNGKFLDLGTGPGTQAAELSKKGFDVTGSDISPTAIQKAKKNFDNVRFVQDDILNSKFEDEYFDYILDRGCFHVFSEIEREKYKKQMQRILKKGGLVFLKCISKKDASMGGNKGPHKFSEEQIRDFFRDQFDIIKIKDTVYYGKINPLPKALFVILKK